MNKKIQRIPAVGLSNHTFRQDIPVPERKAFIFGTTKPRDLEYIIPVPQLAGLLAHSLTHVTAFPVSQ